MNTTDKRLVGALADALSLIDDLMEGIDPDWDQEEGITGRYSQIEAVYNAFK